MTTEAITAPVPGDPDYPLHSEKTIGRYFRDQVAVDPDHEFVVYPDRALRWTYKEFDERTDNLARGLLAIGMRPGDHLGVWARNIPDWLTFMYATAPRFSPASFITPIPHFSIYIFIFSCATYTLQLYTTFIVKSRKCNLFLAYYGGCHGTKNKAGFQNRTKHP